MDTPRTEHVAWREILTRHYAPSLLLACLGVWLHAADGMLVATMIPAIVADIGGTNLISWTVALYEIGSIVAGVASALITMRFGLKLPMAVAALTFAVGCVVSALAPVMWVVLVGRLLQGLGGGGLVAMSFIAVGVLFPKRLMPRAMAAISLLWGMSAFMGPMIGGLFVEYLDWRLGFGFFALNAVGLGLWIVTSVSGHQQPIKFAGPDAAGDNSPAQVLQRFPITRLTTLCAGVVLVALAGVHISPLTTPLLGLAGLTCLVLFLRRDSRSENNRLLPKHPIGFENPVGAGLTMILCFTMTTIAIVVYGPLIMTGLHGASALTAGYVVATASIGWTIAAVTVSGLAEKYDRILIGTGVLVLSISLVGFIYSMARGPLVLIALFSALQGAGFGMAWTFILRRATALSSEREAGRVAGAMPPVQRLGFALGAACIGVVANAAGLANDTSEATLQRVALWAFVAGLPLAGVGLYAAWRFLKPQSPGQPT